MPCGDNYHPPGTVKMVFMPVYPAPVQSVRHIILTRRQAKNYGLAPTATRTVTKTVAIHPRPATQINWPILAIPGIVGGTIYLAVGIARAVNLWRGLRRDKPEPIDPMF